MKSPIKKIVLTGAPSSGKSTTMNRLKEVLGNDAVIVPESAVVLLAGGFPAPAHEDMEQITAFQEAVIKVQTGLETVFARQNPATNLMIFDRGALDGAGFWPPGVDNYFAQFNIDKIREYNKYDFVLFLELPGEKSFGGMNQLRFHNYAQCQESEIKLKQVWSKHPNFLEVKATDDFADKIKAVEKLVLEIADKKAHSS